MPKDWTIALLLALTAGAETVAGFAYELRAPIPLDKEGRVLGIGSQYHAQDSRGGYRFAYDYPGASREEFVDSDGTVQGSYTYRDANNEEVRLEYYADETGFHVKQAALPSPPQAVPVEEPEVAAVRAAHQRLWRRQWQRAAAAAAEAPDDPREPPRLLYVPSAEEVAPLESDVVSVVDPPTSGGDRQLELARRPESVVPTYPGAPDVGATPVSEAPRPLPARGAGIISPDEETVVVLARGSELDAAPVDRPSQQYPEQAATSRRDPGPVDAQLYRVSQTAFRSGRLPVSGRHNLAQVSPSQRHLVAGDETAPVLDDPRVYQYADQEYRQQERARRPLIIVV